MAGASGFSSPGTCVCQAQEWGAPEPPRPPCGQTSAAVCAVSAEGLSEGLFFPFHL